MQHRRFVPILALAAALAVPSGVLSQGTLDQSQVVISTHFASSSPNIRVAQTFTAGRTGYLDNVSLYTPNLYAGSDSTLEIRTTSGGTPTSTVLASEAYSAPDSLGWVDVAFTTPAIVLSGTQYAFVLAASPTAQWAASSDDVYAGGRAMYHLGSGFFDQGYDLAFQTFVTSATSGMGYWKKHLGQTTALLPQTLGSYDVSSRDRARAVFAAAKCGTVKGDGVNCLAAQLLAAKLNVANGAPTGPCALSQIDQANALLFDLNYAGPAAYVLSPEDRAEVLFIKGIVGLYNDGLLAC